MDETERTALIDRYRTGAAEVEAALAGITDEELDRTPAEADGWTARQVAHHLADSEAMAYIRLRRLIAEDDPLIVGYDEPEWARRLHYDRPIASSVAVLRGRPGGEPRAPRAADRRRVDAIGDPQRVRRVRGRRLAPDLRRPPARARRADPRGARRLSRLSRRTAAAAKAAIEGNVASGRASDGGVAPAPGRSWRRSIQTERKPSRWAGAWSWNRLWATCRIRAFATPSREPRRQRPRSSARRACTSRPAGR